MVKITCLTSFLQIKKKKKKKKTHSRKNIKTKLKFVLDFQEEKLFSFKSKFWTVIKKKFADKKKKKKIKIKKFRSKNGEHSHLFNYYVCVCICVQTLIKCKHLSSY